MSAWLGGAYPWLKVLHIVSVIAWMAGLLYLPRLFVYHAEAPIGSDQAQIFCVMERRLLRGIMNPALAMVIVFGLLLAAEPGIVDWHQGWIWAKLALVGGLAVFHHLLAIWRRDFADGKIPHSARFFRRINEVPAVVMIAIVVLVVIKPF
jgi:protoporphyrinogen IX oxidase